MIAPTLNLSGRRRLPLIRQAETAECGLASLAMIAGYHGHDVDLASLRRQFPLSMNGTTLRTLIDVAGAIGLGSRPIRCEPGELGLLRLPAILHWGTNHFVVLRAMHRGKAVIHDPALGLLTQTPAELSQRFTGIALELAPTAAFQPKRERNPLRLGTLISFGPDTMRAFLQTALLSLLIEVLLLSAPFYLQFVIDDAILKANANLLKVLAISFALLLLFRIVALALRGLSTQFIANTLSFEMKARLFHHLIRLPLDWFQKRQVGDIQSRFVAVKAIQTFIAQGALAGMLDGLLGIAVLVLMFLYSPLLAFIVLGSIGTYALLRATTFSLTRRYAADVIVTDAREQTRFLETLRAAQTIKSAGSETVRETQYRNSVAASINAQLRAGNINIGSLTGEQALSGLTDILVVYLGAQQVIATELSVGMLTAFLAYKTQFVARSTSLIEQMFAWRLLDLQLERLSDVALAPREERIDNGGYEGPITGQIQCQGISYRYAFGEKLVIAGLSLTVEAGECVAIVGASGCGKSTLAKILTGLFQPSSGDVLIDGRPLRHWNNRCLRRQISFISQDDQLLAGTIAENIALFDDNVDMVRVRECATTAQISSEVEAMPMGYESLVGDMGSSLSGGQKQRLLIARALYRQPRVLVMDEGTAHLDISNERAVSAALARLTITRVVIAHRPETIAAADRVVSLDRREATQDLLRAVERVRQAAMVDAT
jgi:ATP-binding cassette subfamily B protein RaxB